MYLDCISFEILNECSAGASESIYLLFGSMGIMRLLR